MTSLLHRRACGSRKNLTTRTDLLISSNLWHPFCTNKTRNSPSFSMIHPQVNETYGTHVVVLFP